jgi:NAD(P)-dependent dehydrogenase (short-subunit alcohol dehydrogenase family)
VVAGGLGGIGRAILEWMADRGAKHLIVPSRSGADTPNRIDIVQRLAERGVSIHAPKCDASSLDSVAQMLKDCDKTMPPIKGCIIATMALNVRKPMSPYHSLTSG